MTQIAYRKLYKNHGTSIGYWEGWVEQSGADSFNVVMQYARTLDGKVTRREFGATPKNVGRSNETTSLEQAQLELDSRTRKQIDKGYVENQEDATAPSTNTLGFTKPMLAKPLEKVKPQDIDWNMAYAQPKLDGHRAMFKDGTLYSRQGKVIDLPHIVNAIKAHGLDHLHLDGELYVHGKTLQEISSLVKRNKEESLELVYHVYDTVGQATWLERMQPLTYNEPFPAGAITVLFTAKVEHPDDLQYFHNQNLEEGYEGTMLRWGTEGYQDGKRSKHLLKMKNFQDAEFEIVTVNRGTPYVTPDGIFEVPVWVCKSHNGALFTCTGQGDMYQKHHLWETQEDHIGKQLTVKYHYFSKDGVPQLPVALRFKEDL